MIYFILGFSLALNVMHMNYSFRSIYQKIYSYIKFLQIKPGKVYGRYSTLTVADSLTQEAYYSIFYVVKKSRKAMQIHVIDKKHDNFGVLLGEPILPENILTYNDCYNIRVYTGSNPKLKQFNFNKELGGIIQE